jgi:hypothetical protein
MKNIKDITISIFAIVGFIFILSSFNIQAEPQVTYGTPESHVWSFHLANDRDRAYSLNAVNGEILEINKANYTVLSQAKRQTK